MTITDFIARWPMDQTSGTSAPDDTGNFNATWNSAPTWQAGKIGNCAVGNAAKHASFTMDLSNISFTISGWLKLDLSAPGDQTWFSLGDVGANDQALHLRVVQNGTIRFGMFNDDLDSAVGVYTDNVFQFFVVTFDSTTKGQEIFLDNVSKGTRTSSSNFTGNTNGWLGGFIQPASEQITGSIDEVRVFNRVLSSTELTDLYNFTGAALIAEAASYYSQRATTQLAINTAQPRLLAYASTPSPRTFTRPAGESAFYDVDPYPRLRFRDQHDAYATRFVQQVPPPGSGGFSWHYDRAVYPQLRFRDQHETYPPRGLVPSPVTPVGWTTPYDARLWGSWRRARPELLVYDGQATNSFAFTQAPSGAVSFFDFDKYPALQFRHQHEGHPARGLVPTAATPQGWSAFYDVEAPQKSKASLADHESAEFTFYPPRPLWTDYYDAEVIKGRARDYSEAPAPTTQVTVTGWGSFFDRSQLRPNLTQQHETYPARGLVPTAATPQGWWLPFDLARVRPVPTSLQQFDGYQHFIAPVAVNLGPLGWSMYWDKGKRPLSADRMPFLFEQLYQTPTATTPQGWTYLLDTARVKAFPAHLQQYDGLQRLSFVPPFITLPGDWYDVRIVRPRARDYQVLDRPMFFPPPFPFDQVDVRTIRPRAFPYSVVDQQPTVVVPPSAYVLFPELFKRPRPFPYLTWPEQRVAVLNTPAGTGGPTYYYDRRLFVAHRPLAEVVPFDGRGLPFVVVNLIIHRPGKGGLLTPVLLAATKGQPSLAGIRATPTLGGEVED